MKYASAAAFRHALDDRLRTIAQRDGVDVARLQRRLAYERFLARVFHDGNDRWVLKGGYALELRLGGRARATKDLDFNAPPGTSADLLDELQALAAIELDDHFIFTVAANPRGGELVGPPEGGHRFAVNAFLSGRSPFASFKIDAGRGDRLLHAADHLRPSLDLSFAELTSPAFTSYPLP